MGVTRSTQPLSIATQPSRRRSRALDCHRKAGARECATSDWQRRKRAHDEAKRTAEPKDIEWAYPIEQAFNERFTAHAQVFADFSVDCRTTYCDVRATGYSPESPDVFMQIWLDVQAQKGSEIRADGWEGPGISDDGRVTTMMRLQRRSGT